MAKRKHLIIGCGTAALGAVQKIRSVSQDDEIKLVTREKHSPYSPAVLPYLISGRIKEPDIWLADDSYFQTMNSSLVKGKEVIGVLPEKQEVVYKDGDSERYDSLLIATGSEPLRPSMKGLDEVGFMGFHTLDDCRELQKQLRSRRKIAINGGGLVAMELAAALLEAGYQVNIIVRSRVLRRYFDEDISDFIEDILAQKGAQIYKGAEIREVARDGDSIGMVLSDNQLLNADILVSSTGVKPRLSFLQGTAIKINSGVIADRRMATNIDNIYVAGDAAETVDFFSGQPGINAIAPSAISQGKIAGANMAGEETADTGWISMNIFKFFGHSVCSMGLSAGEDSRTLTEKDERNRQLKQLTFRDNRLVGARFVDIDIDPGVFLYLIRNQVDVRSHQESLLSRPKEISRWLMRKTERQEAMQAKV